MLGQSSRACTYILWPILEEMAWTARSIHCWLEQSLYAQPVLPYLVIFDGKVLTDRHEAMRHFGPCHR